MVVVNRADLEAALAEVRAHVVDARAGIFGPESANWTLMSDVALFVGGGRAALLQLAHPMVAYAIDQHSRTRTDVLGRFQRTFDNVFAMIFGELDEALAAARRVHNIHARIHGAIPEAVGGWAAGAPYHANDASALRWVHATLIDTALMIREQIDGALPPDVRDRYVLEANRMAALFGIPRSLLPDGYPAHVAYMRRMIDSDQIAVAPCAREMAAFLFGRGDLAAGRAQTPVGWLAEAITCELLPPHLVAQFGLRPAPRRARAALAAFRAIYRRLPRGTVALPAYGAALHRVTGAPPSRFAGVTVRLLDGLAQRATGT
ncbi:MAG TPA: oxygenase MpaB family protein [Kofleriaceae bacterium]|nr:oxygenase MpaB family protein [Kofleriaceae bacterium]